PITKGVVMTTATKLTLAAGVLLVAVLAVWQLAPLSSAPVPVQQAAAAPANVAAAAIGDASTTVREPASPAPGPADAAPPPPAIVLAAADQVVVRVVDAASGDPVESYGLREHMSPQPNFFAKESPLLHAGEHAGGRLVLPASELEQRAFVIEDGASLYLP